MWIDELFAEIFSQVKENISLDIDYNRVFEQIKYHSIFMINRSATYMRNDDLFSREIVEKYPVAVDLAIMTVNLLEAFNILSDVIYIIILKVDNGEYR